MEVHTETLYELMWHLLFAVWALLIAPPFPKYTL